MYKRKRTIIQLKRHDLQFLNCCVGDVETARMGVFL